MLSLKVLVTLWWRSTYSERRPHYVSSGPLQKGYKQWKVITVGPKPVVEVKVTYERCPFTKGSDGRDFNGKISVFWTGGRLWELVSYGLYNSSFL